MEPKIVGHWCESCSGLSEDPNIGTHSLDHLADGRQPLPAGEGGAFKVPCCDTGLSLDLEPWKSESYRPQSGVLISGAAVDEPASPSG